MHLIPARTKQCSALAIVSVRFDHNLELCCSSAPLYQWQQRSERSHAPFSNLPTTCGTRRRGCGQYLACPGRVVGDVGCAHCPNASDYIVPDFPRPVPLALERAEEVRAHCGLARVVIAIDDPSLWKAEWGALLQAEGVH
ncbi:hypothetical protein [Devosia sp. 919]|uniref:hypothetical protein n=1 Tax=Devosia sp. 919 TaxID=2726065 RepID=UPI001553C803|nr:hypothetical protein [Devosia sp. 919]